MNTRADVFPCPVNDVGVEWSVRDGRLHIRSVLGPMLSFRNLSGAVTVDGNTLRLRDAVIKSCEERQDEQGVRTCILEFQFNVCGLLWRWEMQGRDGRLELHAVLTNTSGQDLRICDWHLLHGQAEDGGIIALGEQPEQARFFGWRPWNMQVERFADTDGRHDSDTVCHLYDPASGLTALLAFVTIDRMQTHHSVDYTTRVGVTDYRATCTFGEYRLAAGKELRSETLSVSYHRDPYQALESWADAVHDRYQPSFAGTWGACPCAGGVWLDPFTGQEPWPDILLEFTKAVEEKLKGFGIKELSAGTHSMLKDGLPGNWLTFEPIDGHDGGYEALLKTLHERGFSFKFWFSPFWFFGEAEGILEENRENLLKDAEGKPISHVFERGWEFGRGPYASEPLTMYYLDGTHPRTKAYLRKIFTAYRAMGARAYMLDFLSIRPEARLYDDSLLPLEAGREIFKVIREAAGPDTHLQTAVASSPGFIGCINAARVGRDFGEGRPMHPFPNWRNATYCLHDHHFANTHAFVQNAAACWFTHRKIYVNDLNSLGIDKPVPLEHARIAVTLFGLSGGSPLVIADDLRRIAPERLRMLKMTLPRTEGVPAPVDLFEHVAPESCCHILKKAISTDWDSYLLVAVFNTAPQAGPYEACIDFAGLGLDAGGSYRIFEFWNEEYTGTYRGSFSCTVPPEACRLYRISAARPHPWLLATDMHVEQGHAEIASLTWDEEQKTLRGTALRPAGESGSLYFLMPRHLRLINHESANTMKEVIDMQTVIRLPVAFHRDREEFELRFEEMHTPFVARHGWLPYATEEEWLRYVAEHRDPESTRVID